MTRITTTLVQPAVTNTTLTVGQGPSGVSGFAVPTEDPGEGGEVWNDLGTLVVSLGGVGSAKIGTSFTVA